MFEDNQCGLIIKHINDSLEKKVNNTLRNQDLTMTQVTVLLWLREQESKKSSLKELERFLDVAQSTAAGIVKRLEQKKYLESFIDPADKRVKLIKLTKLGEQYCSNAREDMLNTEKILLSGFTDEEQHLFKHFLQKVRTNLK